MPEPDYVSRIRELLAEVELHLDHGLRVPLLQEAARIAETHANGDLAHQIHNQLMADAMGVGLYDQLIHSFSWCLSQSDRDPERFPLGPLLWKYRWAINGLTAFSQVPRASIEALLVDMEQRYRNVGSTLRGYHFTRANCFTMMGDLPEAAASIRAGLARPRDWLTDDPDMEAMIATEHYAFRGEHAESVKAASPYLGRRGDEYYRNLLLAYVLLPHVYLGQHEEGMNCHRRGYRRIASNPRFVDKAASHMAFLALTENLPRATQLFARHLPIALGNVDEQARFGFHLHAGFVLERLLAHGITEVKLRLPRKCPLHNLKGRYETDRLKAWLDNEATTLARAFDLRNQNRQFQHMLAEREQWHAMVRAVPV